MCSIVNTSIWSIQSLCAFEIGGRCNATTYQCECINGYRHDLFALRQRDCSIPPYIMEFSFGVMISMSLCSMLYSYQKLDKPGTLSQMMIKSLINSQIVVVLIGSGYYFNGFVFNGLLAFLGFLYNCYLLFAGYCIVYSIASPLYKMAERSDHAIKIFLKVCYVFFRIAQFCIVMAYWILFDDATNPQNDRGASILVALSIGLYGFEGIFTILLLWLVARKMITLIEIIIELNPNNQSSKIYLQKLKKILENLLKSAPGALISSAIQPILYLTLGYFPFFYLTNLISWLTVPFVSALFTMYAARKGFVEKETSSAVTNPVSSHIVEKEDKQI